MAQTIYSPSAAVRAAERAVEEQKRTKPGEYRSGWDEQLRAVMDRILNREAFSYSLNGDALYRQYRDRAIQDGRMAMADSVGMASALTGGYGNSYAQSVGQQAYQRELDNLADRIPELYALAMNQYRLQSEDLRSQYELLAGRESTEYSRYRDSLDAWQQEADRLWSRYVGERDFDYGNARDAEADRKWQQEYDYTAARDAESDRKWQQQYDYTALRDTMADWKWQQDYNYQAMRDSVADYEWLADFNENKRRYDEEHPAQQPAVKYVHTSSSQTQPKQKEEEEEKKKQGSSNGLVTL